MGRQDGCQNLFIYLFNKYDNVKQQNPFNKSSIKVVDLFFKLKLLLLERDDYKAQNKHQLHYP